MPDDTLAAFLDGMPNDTLATILDGLIASAGDGPKALARALDAGGFRFAPDKPPETPDLPTALPKDGCTWADAINNADAPAWLVRDWIPAGRLTLLAGEGGRGKSRLAVQLAAAIAGGNADWLPGDGNLTGPPLALDAIPAPAVVLSWEDKQDDIARALAAVSADAARMADRLRYFDCGAYGPLWAPADGSGGHIATQGDWTPAANEMLARAADWGARLLVIDPSASAFALDENSRALVRGFTARLDAWAADARCAVLLLSHPPKSGAKFSGSTDWQASARAMLTLGLETIPGKPAPADADANAASKQPDAPCLTLEKSNYGPPAPPLWMRRDTAEFGGGWRVCSPTRAASAEAERAGKAHPTPERISSGNGTGRPTYGRKIAEMKGAANA